MLFPTCSRRLFFPETRMNPTGKTASKSPMEGNRNPGGTMEATIPIEPPCAADPAWDEAFLRVQSYLRAHGLESPVLLNQATAGIIREARENPGPAGTEPVARAMEAAHARIGAWFARS